MSTISKFEEIEAWKRSREITRKIYNLTSNSDFARDFGLRDQIRRSSVSIMSNIAEGFERDGTREFINFLSIAKGSCGEARAQLYVALDQNFITESDFSWTYDNLIETGRMINGLMSYLRDCEIKGRKYR